MIRRLLFFFLLATIVHAGEVNIRLLDPPEQGTVIFVLFDSANTFGDFRDPAYERAFQLDGREMYQLSDVEPGEYALMVFYDENKNARIDKNFIGIPKEPLGFSNGYSPKGPPRYEQAAFLLSDTAKFDVNLYRPLGKRGQIGVGLGVLGRSSPYRDYDAGVYQVIPAVTYIGERLQIFGPSVRYGLAGSGKFRLAAVLSYRMAVYEDDESDFLDGMDERKSTMMAGLAVQSELPGGFGVRAGYDHDVLDEIGGGEARIGISRSFQVSRFGITPGLSLNWMSADVADHDFGVSDSEATEARPAYRVGDTFSYSGSLGIMYELSEKWIAAGSIAVEWLSSDVTESPIVSEDRVLSGFLAVSYLF